MIFRRRLYDAEINELTSLLKILNVMAFFPEEDDELVWVGDKIRIFSVKSAYLNDCPAPSAIVFPRKKIWSKHIGLIKWDFFFGNWYKTSCQLSIILKRGNVFLLLSQNVMLAASVIKEEP
ncbi:hypothetical protein C5167_030507 [Papaver somniferum]|nr:hypothetical protein C5167_030507 [Papaver somniferum]